MNTLIKSRKIIRVLVSVLFGTGVLIFGLIVIWFQVLNSDLTEAEISANKAVINIDSLLDEANEASGSARHFIRSTCTHEVSQSLSKIAINSPHVRIITIIQNGWMVCSSLSSQPYEVNFTPYVDGKLQLAYKNDIYSGFPVLILLERYPEGTVSSSINTSYIYDYLKLLSTHRKLYLRVGNNLLTSGDENVHASNILKNTFASIKSQKYPFEISYSDNDNLPLSIFMEKGKFLIGLIIIFAFSMSLFIWRYAFEEITPYKNLEMAIHHREIIPFYQPVVGCESGKITGVEVLARWKHSSGILISPDVFIPLAEDSGLIIPMTSMLMEQVTKDLSCVIDRLAHPFHISINICATHAKYPNFTDDCMTLLSSFPSGSVHLVAEITEREPFESTPELKVMLENLRKNGISIALDDFGTGYSNLRYLNELPIDFIKIDRSFVSQISQDLDLNKLIECVISMAKKFELDIVAEGIETEFQASYLALQGVSYFQGYYFSKALSRSDFVRQVVLAGGKVKKFTNIINRKIL